MLTNDSIRAFIGELLEEDLQGDLICRWVVDPSRDQKLANGKKVTFYSPRIIAPRFGVEEANPNDTVKLTFAVKNYVSDDQPLFIKLFEINDKWPKFDAKNISIIDGKDIHFRAFVTETDKKSRQTWYEALLPLENLDTYNRRDESDDEYWEIAFKASLNMSGKWPIRFASEDAQKKDATLSKKELKVKKDSALNI